MYRFANTALAMAALIMLPGIAIAQSPRGQTNSDVLQRSRSKAELTAKTQINEWTLGLAGGLLEGAPIRFATDVARVVDDGDNLHVLPIVTRGPSENVAALLYLKGVDAAIINSDSLDEFRAALPGIRNRISYILNLFPSEVHVLARPEIKDLKDLAGKPVNFNTPGTAAAYSGPLIFDRLSIGVQKTFIPHPIAMDRMRSGEIAAVVFVTSKPVDALRGQWGPGFRFLPIEYDQRLDETYLPAALTSADYPQLVPAGSSVPTISVSTLLAVYNWQKHSDRHRRVERLVDRLFGQIDKLQNGFHPKWKEVNLTATVPGLDRSPVAQRWLDERSRSEVGQLKSKAQ